MAFILRRIAAAVLVVASSKVGAADCPKPPCFERAVTVIVSTPPGGATDMVARIWGAQLSKQLGQPVIIDNKAGAGGTIAAAVVAKAAPDSHTILVTNQGAIAIAPYIYRNAPVDPLRDLVAAAHIAVAPQVLVIPASASARTLKKFVSRASERAVNYGSAGQGSLGHLLGVQFAANSGAKGLNHVPYRGTVSALTDLNGGQLDAMFTDLAAVLPHLKNGKVRALAISGETRVPAMPNVPTFAEQGIRGMTSGWYGAFFPARTDPAIVSRLNTETRRALADPEVQRRLRDAGLDPGMLDSFAFTRAIAAESASWASLVRQANIKVE